MQSHSSCIPQPSSMLAAQPASDRVLWCGTEAEGGPIPWGESWLGTPDPGCIPGQCCQMGTHLVSSRTFPRRDELPLL